MNWLGPAKQIEVIALGDVLQIKATAKGRAIDLVGPILSAAWTYFAWRDKHWVFVAFGLFVFASIVWKLFQTQEGELRITETVISARGDLGGWTDGSVELRWGDISGLDYRQGGEEEPSELYARTGRWNGTCVMAGLNREQSEEVIAAIFQRFPYVVMAEDNDGWSLFGNASGLTTLGLSQPKK
jgi:hypothetical protein